MLTRKDGEDLLPNVPPEASEEQARGRTVAKGVHVMKEIAISILALLTVSATSVQAELIGEWHFDEGVGTTAFDSSGSGNDGDIIGATYIADGVCGNALNFDGAAGPAPFDLVIFMPHHGLTDAINSQTSRDYTVAAWVRPSSFVHNARRDVITFESMHLQLRDERVQLVQNYVGGGYGFTTPDLLTLGPWFHLVGVHRENVGIEAYLDGISIGSDFTKTGADGGAIIGHGTQVGSVPNHFLPSFATNLFEGDIDEVRMYNHALTAAEVAALFAEGCGGPLEITCEGFFPPFDQPLLLKKKSKRAIPVKMILLDGATEITDLDLSSPPVVEVRVGEDTGAGIPDFDKELLPPGLSDDGNEFRYDTDDMQWIINLGTKQYKGSLTYVVTAKSGDPSSYVINPSCSQEFTRP